MLMAMPGRASNSASLWGQLVAIRFSARSPKIRNAGMFLRSASLRRQARKACSMRVSFSGSAAVVLVLGGLDWVRPVGFGEALDLLNFFWRLRLETCRPASFITKITGVA